MLIIDKIMTLNWVRHYIIKSDKYMGKLNK